MLTFVCKGPYVTRMYSYVTPMYSCVPLRPYLGSQNKNFDNQTSEVAFFCILIFCIILNQLNVIA